MALLMPKLFRCPKSGDWVARKVIPKDVKADYERIYGIRAEALFRARDASQGEAKRLFGDWIAEVESRIETLRSARTSLGRTLSHKEAIALAGEWHRWFMSKHEENPGDPRDWEFALDEFRDELLRFIPREVLEDPQSYQGTGWTKEPDFRRGIRPLIYGTGEVERFLTTKGVHLQPKALELLLDALEGVMIESFRLLERRAEGDYSPSLNLAKFPAFELKREAGLDAWSLWEAWIAERQPAAQTRDRWRAVFLNLREAFIGRDANSITEDEAQRWAGDLITKKRSAKTVSEVWINAAKTVFGWAKDTKRLDQNPFKEVKITVPREVRNRETKAFTTEETTTILRGTLSKPPARLATQYIAARRWVPWLCAYTGARVGEITQLRDIDVIQRDGVWALRLTPEAGTIKTGEARIVPVHEHLKEQGFLDFVKACAKGPLFYNPDARRKPVEVDPTKPGQSQARKTANHLGEWVRSLGIYDPELRPNHAWRHTFKQIADRCGITERASDAITGHAPLSVARSYGQPTLIDMAEAMKKFPRFGVSIE